jgi:hypothetical protein
MEESMAEQNMEEAIAEIWQLFKETDARLDERFRETDEKLRRLEGLFGDHWGRFVESLVHPNVLRLFRERGIAVQYVFRRAKRQLDGDSMEVDLLLEDGQEVVVVEVKSRVKIEDVDYILEKLSRFPHFFPRYADHRIYGGIAGLDFVGESDRYAYRRGLFVLGLAGEGMVEIRNDARFLPKDFGLSAENS